MVTDIYSSLSGFEVIELDRLCYNAAKFGRSGVFRGNISHLSSGFKITKSNEQIEAGGKVDETRVRSPA